MRLTATIALAAALGIVAGCAGRGLPENATPRTELTSWCSAYAGLMHAAADNKSAMDEAQQRTVTSARTLIAPICTDIDGVDNPQDALVTVRNAVRDLRQIPELQEANR